MNKDVICPKCKSCLDRYTGLCYTCCPHWAKIDFSKHIENFQCEMCGSIVDVSEWRAANFEKNLKSYIVIYEHL